MAQIQDVFQERIGRAVSRFFIHAAGEGLDAAQVEGDVILRIEQGRLVKVTYSAESPARKRGVPDLNPDKLPLIGKDGHLVDEDEDDGGV